MSASLEVNTLGRREAAASTRSLLWLGLLATLGFLVLLGLLGWLGKITGDAQSGGAGLDGKTQTITLALTQEPPQLDSTRTQDVMSSFVLGHVMEGLLNYDEHNNLVPGVAERWDIRSDGATFWLRENSVWSDGKPVTAQDFVFAWRQVVNPENGAPYAFLMYAVKNGEAINTGKTPISELGVRAINERTLEVSFERPVAYFEKLTTFPAYLPIREDFYTSRPGRYAADAGDLLFNGPFVLTQWVHGARVLLEKNQRYWDRGRVKLNVVDMPYITNDPNAHLNLFRDGKIAMAGQSPGLGSENIKQAMIAGWQLHRAEEGSVWYLQFNHLPQRLTRNLNLRKAFQYASDADELVYRAMKNPGYSPAKSLFPVWLRGVNEGFRKEYPPKEIKQDIPKAQEYLQMALKELGLESLPPLTLLVDDVGSGIKQAEYFQALYRRTLGIEIVIDAQIFKQRIAKSQAQEFDLLISGWVPDYDDAMTFGDLLASWNPNNHGRYSSPEVDRQVAIAQNSLDQKVRMDAFGRIQETLLEDAAIIPNYERGTLFVQDARLRGVVRRAIGTDPDFTNAYIVPN